MKSTENSRKKNIKIQDLKSDSKRWLMREYAEKEKEKKKKSEKISEKLENEFQPEEKPKKKDELENEFVPINGNPNNIDKLENKFEPIDDIDLNQKPSFNSPPDKSRRIKDKKHIEERDKKYSTEKPLQKIQKVKEKEDFVVFKETGDLAEMFTIILGDGSIPKDEYSFKVTLNRSEEKQYTKYVNELMQKLFKQKPYIYEHKDADAVRMTVNGRKNIRGIINKGLKSGDKKENQVDVPKWIKKNQDFQKRGLRGLVDTDGSIHIHKHNKTLHISFNNASFPLVKGFKEMSNALDIETVKISPVKGKNTFTTGMESKKEVTKFLDVVKPKKWEYRVRTFGMVLISISDPEKRIKIEKELHKSYPDKRVHHSKDYNDKLRNLCVKHGYDVSNESIIKEIEKMLTYSHNYSRYSKEEKSKLNFHGKNIISDLKKKLK